MFEYGVLLMLCDCADCDCQYVEGNCVACNASTHVEFNGEIHWIKKEVR